MLQQNTYALFVDDYFPPAKQQAHLQPQGNNLSITSAAFVSFLPLGHAFAATTYCGTSFMLPASQDQNSADLSSTTSSRASDDYGRSFTSQQTFCFPSNRQVSNAPPQVGSAIYLGTSGHEQDNADAKMC